MGLLYQNTVMSFEQVRLWAFDGKHKTTVCNRLTKLERMGLIRRINVGNFIYKTHMRPISVVLQITRSGITAMKNILGEHDDMRSEPVPVNIQSLIHDLELNDVVHQIKMKLSKAVVTNGKLLETNNFGDFKKVPDALLEIPQSEIEMAKGLGLLPNSAALKGNRNLRLAVELELTVKSDRRYREIINAYRLSQMFDQVLYLSADTAIIRKVQSVLIGFPIKGDLKPHHGIFSFLEMQKLFLKDAANGLENNNTRTLEVF